MAASGLLIRMPFMAHTLYHGDSVQFLNGMRHFDVSAQSPHPPGYIGFILLARAAAAVFGSNEAGLGVVPLLAGVCLSLAVWRLGATVAGESVGRAAGLLALGAPLALFYGCVQLTYVVDAVAVTLFGLYAWRVWRGDTSWRTALLAALWLGVSGSLRATSLLFLLPLAFAVALRLGRQTPARALAAAALVAASIVAWLWPTVALSGGWESYLGAVRASGSISAGGTALWRVAWSGPADALLLLLRGTVVGFGLAAWPALFTIQCRAGATGEQERSLGLFLVLWNAPALAFYLLVHMPSLGYLLMLLPGWLVGAAVLLARLRTPAASADRLAGAGAVTGIAYFLGGHLLPLGLSHNALTAGEVRHHDACWRNVIAAAEHLPAGVPVLVPNSWTDGWVTARHYLTDRRLYEYSRRAWRVRDVTQGGGLAVGELLARHHEIAVVARTDQDRALMTGVLAAAGGEIRPHGPWLLARPASPAATR
jgi:hypothetical protein